MDAVDMIRVRAAAVDNLYDEANAMLMLLHARGKFTNVESAEIKRRLNSFKAIYYMHEPEAQAQDTEGKTK